MDIASSYNGSNATYRLLRAYNWGPMLMNLGYYKYRGPLGILNWFKDLSLAQRELAFRSIGLLDVQPGDDVLDIACGRGMSSYLIQRLNPQSRVVGIDLLPENMLVAQTLFANNGPLRYQVGDAGRLEFPDASFDRVHCLEAAFHFPDRAAFLRECRRVLRPSGKLVVVDIVWRDEQVRQQIESSRIDLLREIWQWSDLYSIGDYRRQSLAAGFRIAAEHDWSPRVTGPLMSLFVRLAWLARRPWGRKLLHLHNPQIASLTDDDWRHIDASAAAHAHFREHTRYMAFEFLPAGTA